MTRKSSEMFKEYKENLRGGNGTAELIHMYKDEEMDCKTKLFVKFTLPQNASIGYHKHVNEEETYVIISGEATVSDNGEMVKLHPGDAMLTKNGDSHSIENQSSEPLIFMATITEI